MPDQMNEARIQPWYHPDGDDWAYGVSENGEPARGGFAGTAVSARKALRELLVIEFGFTSDEARKAVREVHA